MFAPMEREAWIKMLGGAQVALEEARAEALLRVAEAKKRRDAIIREAVADGLSKSEVGRILGLTREQVRRICEGK